MDFIITPFGWLMRVLYDLVSNYGMALLLFTVITRIIMLPISISQQKSMAKMSVYNPLIQEVQKKYANNRQKQQEELTKLYTDYNIKPSMGCMPMMIQMAFVMILYQVIQKPLRFMVGVGSEAYTQMLEIAKAMPGCPQTYQDTFIINQIQKGSGEFSSLLNADMLETIKNLDFTFFGVKSMDLTVIPELGLNLLVLIPVISGLSMILTQYISGKVSGQAPQGGMALFMYGMSLWIAYLGFTFPAALSLYWFYSNILGVGQSMVLRKFYSPEKFKAQIEEELAAKRAAKKQKKTVVLTDEVTGEKKEANMTEAELARVRLAKARALQDEKFRKQAEAAAAAAAEAAAAEKEAAVTAAEEAVENGPAKEDK